MIVRISGEGQFRVPDGEADRLTELERKVVNVLDSGSDDGYSAAYADVISFVHEHGEPLGDDELEGSDVILPPADLSYAEAQVEFTGEGLIPD